MQRCEKIFNLEKNIQVKLPSFYQINVETTIGKCTFFFLPNLKNKSPANDFLMHKCRKKRKVQKINFFFQI